MITWNTYSKKDMPNVSYPLSSILINEFGSLIKDFFNYSGNPRPHQSKVIKDRLSILGKKKLKGKPEYKVYAHGISKELSQKHGGHFRNAEWLYDMHWYLEGDDHYTTTLVPLVMECEWNPVDRWAQIKVPYGGFKYDFQKLLLANAELRLMIFKIQKQSDIEALTPYFVKSIKNYPHLPKGSRFLFVAFHDAIKTFHYLEFFK